MRTGRPQLHTRVMASIRKEISIDAPVGEAWAALRDWGALHQRLAPGSARNGLLARERLTVNHRLDAFDAL
jgi:hypothetical protein